MDNCVAVLRSEAGNDCEGRLEGLGVAAAPLVGDAHTQERCRALLRPDVLRVYNQRGAQPSRGALSAYMQVLREVEHSLSQMRKFRVDRARRRGRDRDRLKGAETW